MKPTYDPLEFIGNVELFTIAMLGSFITWKLLNAMYDNLYEPAIDMMINSGNGNKYYIRIGKYYVQMDVIFKEIIKWIVLIILLMLIYNIVIHHRRKHN